MRFGARNRDFRDRSFCEFFHTIDVNRTLRTAAVDVTVGEGVCTPAHCDGRGEAPGPASESLPRRKPRGGRALEGATYGDLRVADGAPGSVLKRRGEDCVDRKDDGELVRSCRCAA